MYSTTNNGLDMCIQTTNNAFRHVYSTTNTWFRHVLFYHYYGLDNRIRLRWNLQQYSQHSAISTAAYLEQTVGPFAFPITVSWTIRYLAPRYLAPRYLAPRYLAPRYLAPRYLTPRYLAPRYLAPRYPERNCSFLEHFPSGILKFRHV